jgi:hypothetical protein
MLVTSARVAELVDASDLGSDEVLRAGSIPVMRTTHPYLTIIHCNKCVLAFITMDNGEILLLFFLFIRGLSWSGLSFMVCHAQRNYL